MELFTVRRARTGNGGKSAIYDCLVGYAGVGERVQPSRSAVLRVSSGGLVDCQKDGTTSHAAQLQAVPGLRSQHMPWGLPRRISRRSRLDHALKAAGRVTRWNFQREKMIKFREIFEIFEARFLKYSWKFSVVA